MSFTNHSQNEPSKIDVSDSCLFVIAERKEVTDQVAKHFNDFGFSNVRVFNNPIAAVEQLHYVQADLIVAEDNLPGVTVEYLISVTQKIAHQQNAAVAAITSDVSQVNRESLINSGAMWVLEKPIVAQDLLLCTIEALDRKVNRMRTHQLQKPNSLKRQRTSKRRSSHSL